MAPSAFPSPRVLLSSLLLTGAACAHRAPAGEPAHSEHPAHEGHAHDHSAHAGHAHGHSAHAGHAHGEMSHHGALPHRFENAEEWAARFEDPARDAWQQPEQVLAALALRPDAKVADIGSATGYFAVRLARAVPRGQVYGVDIEPDMARYLGERARQEGLRHLTPVLGLPEDPRLPEPVDLILIVNTYHHLGERVDYLRRLRGKLTPGGRVAVIDFRKDSTIGPPPAHKLPPEQVKEELRAAGYQLVEEHGFLPQQYFLVFQHGKR